MQDTQDLEGVFAGVAYLRIRDCRIGRAKKQDAIGPRGVIDSGGGAAMRITTCHTYGVWGHKGSCGSPELLITRPVMGDNRGEIGELSTSGILYRWTTGTYGYGVWSGN